MSDELVVRHCAPTMAGLKTGNIFNCTFSCTDELTDSIRHYNNCLSSKGLRIIPLRTDKNRALIYVFRPELLGRDLKSAKAKKLLVERGYPIHKVNQCVMHLMNRLRESDGFPHEIGLFLGYPPEDVEGFIENRAEGCKCVGCWKVYGDEAAAKEIFAKYKKCTRVYCARHSKGTSIERLTVTV
ncbi:MAG: DUF3793 family protein [Clostridia bacterium]|nr:DUF3793 family protein [Clostridia bacterium]